MELARLSELRPRSVWDLVDDAFDLYRERFALLAGIAAIPFVPAQLLNTFLTALAYQRMQRGLADPSDASNILVPMLIFVAANAVGQPIVMSAAALQSAVTADAVQQRLRGEAPDARAAWRRTLPKLVPVLWAGLLASLLLLLASAVSFGAGLWLAAPPLMLIPLCQVLEKKGIGAAFKRAWNLGSSNYGKGLGLTALLGTISYGLQTGLSGLVQLLFLLVPGNSLGQQSTTSFVAAQAAGAVASLFLAPLGGIALTLLYFDCRVRREGLDLEALASETGVALAEVPR